jgi:hypothetical protein
MSNTVKRMRCKEQIIIATGYGLEGPGIESRWGENFRTPTEPLVQWVPGLSWGCSGRDVVLTTHPF